MGRRVIKWGVRVIASRDKVAEWYMNNMGTSAVGKFLNDLNDAAISAADMPTIGVLDTVCSTEKRKYYSVLVHPKYRLIYRYTSKTIYFVGLRCNVRQNKFS